MKLEEAVLIIKTLVNQETGIYIFEDYCFQTLECKVNDLVPELQSALPSGTFIACNSGLVVIDEVLLSDTLGYDSFSNRVFTEPTKTKVYVYENDLSTVSVD
jgi:hypothetical protein